VPLTPPLWRNRSGRENGATQRRRKSEEAGIDLHLLKPADPRMLAGLLERFQKVVR
jgi:hypothetical protein